MKLMSHLNFARTIVGLSLVGSCVLAYTGWQWRERRIEAESALARDVPLRAQQLQVTARRLTRELRELNRFDFENGVMQPESFIRSIAAQPQIALGQIDISRRMTPAGKGVQDVEYTVQSQIKRAEPRTKIANFMYRIEEQSRGLMRVTGVLLKPAQKKLNPEDVPVDNWTYDIKITMRRKEEA